MGLDFSHGDAHWGYSGFNIFREKLAHEIGMDLRTMEGFNGNIPFSKYNDDILPLLDHSDCDGELTVDECIKIVPRLREIIGKWSDDDRDKTRAMALADGMEEAINENEIFEFC